MMIKSYKPGCQLVKKLISISLWSFLVVGKVSAADVADIQQILIDMKCEPGEVDGIWGEKSTGAYERLMRETSQPVYTCMPGCSEPVSEMLNALKANNAECGSSISYDSSQNNTSAKTVAFNNVVNSCDPWSVEVEAVNKDQDVLFQSEHDISSLSVGDDLLTHEAVRYYHGLKPTGQNSDYTTVYDRRGISRTKTKMSEVEAFYTKDYDRQTNNGGHYIRLACKDGSKCIQLMWDSQPVDDNSNAEMASVDVFVNSKILPVCAVEMARDGANAINEK